MSNKIIAVRRIPPFRVMRRHPLGLAIGMFFVLVAIFFPSDLNFLQKMSLLVWFGIGTYVGLSFAAVTVLFGLSWVVGSVMPLWYFPLDTFWGSVILNSTWYAIGYLVGVSFATAYNFALWAHINWIGFPIRESIFRKIPGLGLRLPRFGPRIGAGHKLRQKIAFAYDQNQPLNIIKSPIETEVVALGEYLGQIPYLAPKIATSENLEENIAEITRRIEETLGMLAQQASESKEAGEDFIEFKNLLEEMNITCERKLSETDKVELSNILRGKVSGIPKEKALEIIKEGIHPIVEKYSDLNDWKLYKPLLKPPNHPYTIAFVANPELRKRGKSGEPVKKHGGKDELMADPILDPLLFLKTVDRALESFERNEVLGQADIWNRVRIITYFDENGPSYVDGFQKGDLSRDLLVPTSNDVPLDIVRKIKSRVEDANKKIPNSFPEDLAEEIDVVYVLSASGHYTRSTAVYSDLLFPKFGRDAIRIKYNNRLKHFGVPFEDDRPNGKASEDDHADTNGHVHEYYACVPGLVALNALTATEKTFVHEFAHAMSSAVNGAVADEYTDEVSLTAAELDPERPIHEPFYMNRRERKQRNGALDPMPNVMRRFKDAKYLVDLQHPSAEENWRGFFPERHDVAVPCTMDRGAEFIFDKLISAFMYNRLYTKIHRKDLDDDIIKRWEL